MAEFVGQKLLVVHAHTDSELEAAFVTLAQQHPGALMVVGDAFFLSHRDKIVESAARLKLPTIYNLREYAVAGGLMSYGTSITDAHRIAGLYAGRILKGEKPADLPVQQATKVELFINLKTAKALGVSIPLLAARPRRRGDRMRRRASPLRRLDAELRLLLGVSAVHARGDAVLGQLGREDAADFRLLVDIVDLIAADAL